jgi:DNA-binding NtrC family response regulator
LPSDISLQGKSEGDAEEPQHFRGARAAVLAAFERRYVENLLRKHKGNVTHAAREANKERRAFGRLIKKHGIDRRAT